MTLTKNDGLNQELRIFLKMSREFQTSRNHVHAKSGEDCERGVKHPVASLAASGSASLQAQHIMT